MNTATTLIANLFSEVVKMTAENDDLKAKVKSLEETIVRLKKSMRIVNSRFIITEDSEVEEESKDSVEETVEDDDEVIEDEESEETNVFCNH